MSGTPPPASLLQKTATGTGWVIAWRMVARFLGLISTLVMVRLLLPEDFGLVALGASFVQTIEGLSLLGVEDAVIREKAPTRDIYDSGFTLNVLRGLLTGAIILALAIPAGSFFGDPRLATIMAALAAATLLDGFTNIGTVDFRRELTFRKEFNLYIVPRVLGIVFAMVAAFTFRSYWALVVGIISHRGLRVAMSYYMHPFRPRFSLRAWRSLVGYSAWTWAVSMVGLMRDRSDSILIGRMLDPTHVGIYSIGAEVASLPTTELVEPLCRASFSSFAAGRNADLTPGESYLRIIATMSLVTLPAGVGISLVADPLVKLVFGAMWSGTTPLVQILGLASTVTVFGYVSSTLFRAHGLMLDTFRIALLGLVIRVALLIVLIDQMALVGAAIAVALAITVEQGCYLVLALRRFGLRPIDLLRPIRRSLAATAVMAAVMTWMGLGWHQMAPREGMLMVTLFGSALVGAAIYAAALLGLWFASGRPAGAETDFLALLQKLLGGMQGRLRAIRGGATG